MMMKVKFGEYCKNVSRAGESGPCLIGLLIVFLVCYFPITISAAPQLAFPGADGYGRYTVGGRGGKVYVVTRLDDDPAKPQPGSLRHAIQQRGARIITFAVSGVIHLQDELIVENGFLTLAGQTSPHGVVLRGQVFSISAPQVIVRYLRFRLGRIQENADTISVKRVSDIIFDHCSFSWSIDETASFYSNVNFTLQYSIIGQSLNNATHSKGKHGYGGIWGGAGASYHHNLIAHHASRTPRINGHRLNTTYGQAYEFIDVRHNVMYNWGHHSAYGAEDSVFNMLDNYFIEGPASTVRHVFQFYKNSEKEEFGKGFFRGNLLETRDGHINRDQAIEVRKRELSRAQLQKDFLLEKAIESSRMPFFLGSQGYLSTRTAQEAYDLIINQGEVGANRTASGKFMDSVDTQILEDVKSRSVKYGKNGIVDNELQVIGKWSDYGKEFIGKKTNPKLRDLDLDGMPDQWEKKHNITEPSAKELDPVYSNIEVWLNELGNFQFSQT